jgi:hypothetical protein
MRPIDANLDLVQAMMGEAEEYLASPELFWPLAASAEPGAAPYPRLTLGGLMLAMDELRAAEPRMDTWQASAWARRNAQWDALRSRLAAGVARKSALELRSRLDLWGAYLGELGEAGGSAEKYGTQVANRVMASRLAGLARGEASLASLLTQLTSLDERLRGQFDTGSFVWDLRLQTVYPPNEFWFLYGKPREHD